MIWIIIIGIIILFIVIANNALSKEKERVNQVKCKLNEKIKRIDNFNPHKRIESDNASYILLFDDINKKMAYARSYYLAVVNYHEILDVEIITDHEIISSKSTSKAVGRAVVGGLLLGGVGAIVGGVTGGNKNREFVTNVFVVIKTSNTDKAIFKIEVFNAQTMCGNSRIKKGSLSWNVYLSCLKKAREIELQIGRIIEDNIQSTSSITSNRNCSADDILKLHSLLKEGILTQEEFNKEKSKILSKE